MKKLTLSMIVKNEENYLRECLESVKNVVDEIVIVDTGSTDSTIKIAKKYNASVYSFAWVNDFSAARNFALSKSTGDWILYLDADERLNANSIDELKSKIANNKNFGINCIINNIDEQKNTPKLMKYVRLFKNSKNIKFNGKAHEQIEPSLNENEYKIIDSSIEITHLGYNVSEAELMIKANRNLELLLDENNSKPSTYLAFQIANSYLILKNVEKSVIYFKIAVKGNSLRRELKSVCFLHLADYEMRNNNLEKAKSLVDNGLRLDKTHPLLNMIASQVYEKLNNGAKSLNYCLEAYKMNNLLFSQRTSNNVLDIIIDKEKLLLEGLLLAQKFNDEKLLYYFLTQLSQINTLLHNNVNNIINNTLNDDTHINNLISLVCIDNLEIILKLLKTNSNNNSKLIFYSNIYDQFNNNPFYLLSFGSFLLNTNQHEEARVVFEAALQLEECDDSVIFYLASIYTATNNIQSLLELLVVAENKAKNNKVLQVKLGLLLEKLQPILG